MLSVDFSWAVGFRFRRGANNGLADWRNVLRFIALLGLTISAVQGQNLTDEVLGLVADRLAEGATHSWEIGTRAQAIINFNVSDFSVFPSKLKSPPTLPASGSLPSSITQDPNSPAALAFKTVLNLTQSVINTRPTQNPPNDAQPFFANDGSAGDPNSIGFAALLMNWTGQTGADFSGAARQQLNWLYNDVPRSSKGAFSHRQSEVQLWADSMSMVPPFLAYYGLTTNNRTLLLESYTQIKLYRDVLRDGNKSTSGLWFHIAMGNVSSQDYGHWATGNAWVLYGMSRVLATIQQSQFSNSLKGQQKDLGNWIDEILKAMYSRIDQSGLFWNYVDVTSGDSAFLDAASSCLVAAAVYRNAVMRNQVHHIPDAEKTRKAISIANSNSTSSDTTSSSSSSSTDSQTSSSSAASSTSSASSSDHSSSSSGSSSSTSTAPSSTSSGTASSNSGSSSTTSGTSTAPTPTQTFPPSAFVHFSDDGWLQPVVDPENWFAAGQKSPESQAFVLEMQSAYLEWVKAGMFGVNDARKSIHFDAFMFLTVVGLAWWML